MSVPPMFAPYAELARIRAEMAVSDREPTSPSQTFATIATFAGVLPEMRAELRNSGVTPGSGLQAPALPRTEVEKGTPAEWAPDDWKFRFEERVAVLTIDGDVPEAEARRIAFEDCVVRWLDQHSVRSAPDCCTECGKADSPGNIVPFGAEPLGHVWLHTRCWEAWYARRHVEAAAALAAAGIPAPTEKGNTR